MSKSIVRAACGLLILTIVIAGLAGCSNEMAKPDYADAIAETALQTMNECDWQAHRVLYTPEIQEALTEDIFNPSCQQIKAIIGDYIDKEYQETSDYNGYVLVTYEANFSEEPDGVIVGVYFQEIDGENYIAGLALDSPKLRESLATTGE
ncbi:MAG: hypothetical protein PVJ81_01795 [Dehalococcoidia bacterium]|jgi:hypothetical protein